MREPIRFLWLSLLVAGAAPALAHAQAPVDTVIAIDPEGRLDLENFEGSVTVEAWNRPAVRVVADGPRSAVRIHGGGSSISIRTEHQRGPRNVDYRLTVPAALDLSIQGVSTDVTVRGAEGRLQVHTVNGDVSVQGGRGVVELNSVQGTVSLSGGEGRAELSSVNDGVRVDGFRGDLRATTVNGEVNLRGVESGSVESTTVNGSITYQGSIRSDGWYRFNTHNGEIGVVVPSGTSATVEVSTFNGDFQADFPVTFSQSRSGKKFNFTLGGGGARIELSAFNGTIRLRSPGRSGGGS
ncbi:MAG TPA: DUF4097 family beta strand repeat-containing protein [Gemmatimonadota bacterium]|nr:DUF4097 family beta strand repeat-containing protein [Gemmatimonadota bacterium]